MDAVYSVTQDIQNKARNLIQISYALLNITLLLLSLLFPQATIKITYKRLKQPSEGSISDDSICQDLKFQLSLLYYLRRRHTL